jgi:hypothetical protein
MLKDLNLHISIENRYRMKLITLITKVITKFVCFN